LVFEAYRGLVDPSVKAVGRVYFVLNTISLERARLLNILTMVRDALYRHILLPGFDRSVKGRIRVGAKMMLPYHNILAGSIAERKVRSLEILVRRGSLYVEPRPEAGIAPIAVYGPSRLYSIVYGGLLLKYNSALVMRAFKLAGDNESSLYSFYTIIADMVYEWYKTLPRLERPLSPLYAVSVDVEEVPGNFPRRCDRLRLIGYVDPSMPVDRGLRLECDGESLQLRGVEDEWLTDAYELLAERVREDLNLIEDLYERISRISRGGIVFGE
jgi:hypothetical protein